MIQQMSRQGFQPRFPRHEGFGSALGPVGQIEVFYSRPRIGLQEGAFQLGSELPLLPDALQHRFTSFVKIAQRTQPCLNVAEMCVRQSIGRFFPVAGDERNGCTFVEEPDCRLDSRFTNPYVIGYPLADRLHLSIRRFGMVFATARVSRGCNRVILS